jgi:GAF domain-containing protein
MTDWQNIQRAQQWQTVLKSLTALSYRSHDLNGYLHEIACTVSELLKSDWSIVTIHEGARGKVVASSLDIGDAETAFSVHESISEVVVQSGQPFWIENIQHHPEEASRMAGYVCYLGVPLRIPQSNVIGTICSFSLQPQHYDADAIATVELFAERAATAVQRPTRSRSNQTNNRITRSSSETDRA